MKTFPAILALTFAFALATPLAAALAQATAALGGGKLELDAAEGVEWRREERLIVAEGRASARQDDISLRADRLVAAYRDRAGGGFEIFRVDAEGDVRIENGTDVATAVRAAFDLEARAIVLSGPGVAYTGAAGAVTAREFLEYDLKTRRAVARGDAVVEVPEGQLSAPVIEARFDENSKLTEARASGGVAVRTASETVTGARANYDVVRQRAVIEGDVRIVRGPNILTGTMATIDFASGISTLSGGDAGRVRGLVFPKAVQ